MVAFELFKCKSWGLEVRRKRLAQRYCSDRCRNAAVQNRKRRKQSRSGDGEPPINVSGLKKRRLLPPCLEAVTDPLKSPTKSEVSDSLKPHPYPHTRERLAKALQRPVVNLTGRELPSELASLILATETASYPLCRSLQRT